MAYSRLPDHNWVLISVLPASSIQAVVASASLNVLGIIVLASVLYMVLALIWSRYFRRMLDEISTVIRASRTQPDEVHQGGCASSGTSMPSWRR